MTSDDDPRAARRQRTADRLVAAALDLFERQGYDATSAAQVAAAAGVTEMTFFRHFGAKERVVLDDPYDPVLVEAVAAQPTSDPPLARTVAGLRAAWRDIPEDAVEIVRRRTRVVARTPALRGAVGQNNARTEDAVVERLVADGCDPLAARAAVGATLAALTAALLHWATTDDDDLGAVVHRALDVLDPRATLPGGHDG
ncbi:TetR/AcrR family transcriptional regulator [Cellulosimicrobium marinum]|uniref:TetR/AcrR family transcriptional regulator n=1 Tax=Cellulosimicrobium marinum TaxID=1638992 RepID=UPI001E36A92A|nr:TetR/AcrR family transcriptional regulator [Cellulosimicrobium marinum]MCB7136241.1 TetR/AcrR family transcriptional regulator [Cellulosimicrobium marinum]